MKSLVVLSVLCKLSFSSYLPHAWDVSVHPFLDPHGKRSTISYDTNTNLLEIAENITQAFREHQSTSSQLLLSKRATPTSSKASHVLIERAPLATTTVIPNDPAPDGTVWDESFAGNQNADRRAAVKTAWNEGQRLANLAFEALQDLRSQLQANQYKNDENAAKNHIASISPPMAQLFASNRSQLPQIEGVFQKMLDIIPHPNAQGRNGEQLRLALGANMRTSNRQAVCGRKTGNPNPPTYAATYAPDLFEGIPNDLQTKYRIPDSMIVLCPNFFPDPGNPNALGEDRAVFAQSPMLDQLRTPGQTLVHEWAHLHYIRRANFDAGDPEVYGFEEAATLARDDLDRAMRNADNFAVFASYNAYNQEPYAPSNNRPNAACKDVWPRDGSNNAVFRPAKPNKDTFP